MASDAALILRENGWLSDSLYDNAVRTAARLDIKPVEALILGGIVTPHQVAAEISMRSMIAYHQQWPCEGVVPEVIGRLPAFVAVEHRAVPLYVGPDADLVVAMADPVDEAALAEIAFFAQSPLARIVVTAVLASRAVEALYGVQTSFLSLWRRATRDEPVPQRSYL